MCSCKPTMFGEPAANTAADHFEIAARTFWPEHAPILYRSRDEVNARLYGGRLPSIPIIVGLTAHGHALGNCGCRDDGPIITMHPSTLTPATENPWRLTPDELNPAFVADVVTHEMIHALHCIEPPTENPDWCPNGHSDDDTHSEPHWCAEIMRQSPLVGLGPIISSPWRQHRIAKADGGGIIRRPVLPGSISRKAASSWPYSLRPRGYYFDHRPWFDRIDDVR